MEVNEAGTARYECCELKGLEEGASLVGMQE